MKWHLEKNMTVWKSSADKKILRFLEDFNSWMNGNLGRNVWKALFSNMGGRSLKRAMIWGSVEQTERDK